MFKEDETQYCKNCYELQEQLDQLKSENKHLIDLLNQALKDYEKAIQTLTEIKEIVSSTLDCGEWIGQGDNKMEQILNKISEVEE